MHFQYTPYILPLIAAAVIAAVLVIYAFRHRRVRGALPFGMTMLLVVSLASSYSLELTGTDLSSKLPGYNGTQIFFSFAPVCWLIMVLRFTGQDRWITRCNVAFLLVPGILLSVLTWTNELHGLIYSQTVLDIAGRPPNVSRAITPAFWIFYAYFLSIYIVCELLLVMSFRRKSALYRAQSIALFTGPVLLFTTNIMNVLSFAPVSDYDLTPAVAGVFGIILAWSIFRFKLFDIVPVARENIIENMADGLVVLDARNRVVDINPAARTILGISFGQTAGQESGILFKNQPEIVDFCRDKPDLPRDLVIDTAGIAKRYEVSCLPLSDKQAKHYGYSITFHDVTELRANQVKMLEQQKALATSRERERLARDLHDNLGQVFGFINVQAQAIKRELLDNGVDIAANRIDRLIEVAQSTHREMHEYIQGIKRPIVVEKDFFTVLKREIEQFKGQAELDVKIEIPGTVPDNWLMPETEAHILNITREALNNIRKHAQAKNIYVKVYTAGRRLYMTIADNGKGFDSAGCRKRPAQGLGLGIMQERAAEIGGMLSIDSVPGGGTRISLSMPLQEELK